MVAEEVVVSLSGGGPWGFRLQGGAEHHRPLQVAKVRRRSKACRAGLKEDDVLVAIGDHICTELSHAQAMSLIDIQRATLSLRVKRPPVLSGRSASPQSSGRGVLSPTVTSHCSVPGLYPTVGGGCVTSPPDSEAYYGETDSDADIQTHTLRRQRRTPPHTRSPARYDDQDEEETSEMSGYESAPDGGVFLQAQWEQPRPVESLPGVPQRELVYQPPQAGERTTPARTPHTLTPTPDQGLMDGEGEGDSGFQEAGGYVPLVSHKRAKEALMLGSSRQLVPMVGPQQGPLSDELSTTYMKKARQAKLQCGESVVEKQVKEARTKCRSIASLLTDAPNPNSKGVLMFKKRRQRAKKYTLTCFGKAEGEGGEETEGETGGEMEEEGRSSILSGSELEEEDDFAGSFDPTWDSGYLDVLDRRSSACPSSTPTTPTAANTNPYPGLDVSTYQSPGCVNSVGQSPGSEFSGLSASRGSRLENGGTKQPVGAPMSPHAVALTNGGSVVISRASVVLSPPTSNQPGQQVSSNMSPVNINPTPDPVIHSDHSLNMNPSSNPVGVLNRTARPFTPGPLSTRSPVAPVLFRPPQPKPTTATAASKPMKAVSAVTIQPQRYSSGPEASRAVSTTSLYISPRNNSSHDGPSFISPPLHSPPPPTPSTSRPLPAYQAHPAPFSPQFSPPSIPFTPPPSQGPVFYQTPTQPFSLPSPQHVQPFPPPNGPPYPPPSSGVQPGTPTPVAFKAQPSSPLPPPASYTQPPLPPPCSSYSIQTTAPATQTAHATQMAPASVATAGPPQAPPADPMASREKRISVPAARTGILQEARRRANNKPMFSSVQKRDVSPNPALLSMLQNMDNHSGASPGYVGPSGDAGHESGPEEDWLRLGAEACNFMQAQRGPKPPPVAPKPQASQAPQLEGKGGRLFARRQSRMERYVVDRSPSVAAAPYSPAQSREHSPTPSLPATWKYSSNIRAPPPISYNPLLSPSCPTKAQKPQRGDVGRAAPAASKGRAQKGGIKAVDIMSHQPYQLNSALFTYGAGTPHNPSPHHGGTVGASQLPMKTACVVEVKRFSTPPPVATAPPPKVLTPRSVTSLGEPTWCSDLASPPSTPATTPYHPFLPQRQPVTTSYLPQTPQWAASPLSPPPPPAPTAPLPQLPTLSLANQPSPQETPVHIPTFSHLQGSGAEQANRQFKSAPDLSPLSPANAHRPASQSTQPAVSVPRPRFSTSNLGLQPCVWRAGSNVH